MTQAKKARWRSSDGVAGLCVYKGEKRGKKTKK